VKVKGEGIGVSVCYDTYFPDVTRTLSAKGATILVDIKANPWPIGPKTEKAFKDGAWKCVQEDTGIRFGVTSCLVGQLYDTVFQGRSAIVADGLLTADGSGYVAQARTFDQDEIVAGELASNSDVRK
jgi:predicted amidohydrolase